MLLCHYMCGSLHILLPVKKVDDGIHGNQQNQAIDKRMKLSVIIVSYNVKYFLEQCLHSVEAATEGIDAEVVVVDNASSDGSCEYLSHRFPNIRFIRNKENKGFARANNQAIRTTDGEYVLLLNPDTIVTKETFADFINFMDSHPNAGGAGAYMLRTDGRFALESRRGLPTPFVAFCKMSGLASIFPKSRIFGRYYMRYLNEQQVNQIEIISGAFMFLRRKTFEKSGLLDEDFFMYGEDIDLSYRILKSGYKNYFLPSRILHYKGESTQKSSYRYVYTFYQAMQLFFNKHYSHYSLLLSTPISLAIWCRAILAYIGNQLRHRKKNPEKPGAINAIAVGSKEMLDDVRQILEREHPNGKHKYIQGDETTLPQGHIGNSDTIGYNVVIYDTDSYTYKQIFKLLEETPGNSLKIATYSTGSKVLITEGNIYRMEP